MARCHICFLGLGTCFFVGDLINQITVGPMIGENRQLVTNGLVEFEKQNNRLNSETAGKLPITFEEFYRI